EVPIGDVEVFLENLEEYALIKGRSVPDKYKKVRANALVQRGNLAFKAGRYAEARDLYNEAIAEDPANSKAHFGKYQVSKTLSDNWTNLTFTEQAAEALKQALKLDPSLDGAELQYSGELIGIYLDQLGDAASADEVRQAMLARALKEEVEPSKTVISREKDKASALDAMVREQMEYDELNKRIKEKEKELEAITKGDKDKKGERPDYVRLEESIKIDKTVRDKKEASLESNRGAFERLAGDMKMFNQVIGNARGMPADEGIAYLEAFYYLLGINRLLEDRNIRDRIDLALAEAYNKKGGFGEAREKVDLLINTTDIQSIISSIVSDDIPVPEGSHLKLVIEALILRAGLSLKTDKPERFMSAVSDMNSAVQIIAIYNLIYGTKLSVGEAYARFNDILTEARKADVSIADNTDMKRNIFGIFMALARLGDDGNAASNVMQVALSRPGDRDSGSFIVAMLDDKGVSDMMKENMIKGLIDDTVKEEEKKAWVRSIERMQDVLGSLKESYNKGVKAAAMMVLGLIETSRRRARQLFKKATALQEELKEVIRRGRTAEFYRKRAEKAFRERKYKRAIANYEKAVSMDPALKKDAVLMLDLTRSYQGEAGRYKRARNRRRNLPKQMEMLQKALETAPDNEKAGIRSELIASLRESAGIRMNRYRSARPSRKRRAFPALRKQISELNYQIGSLHRENGETKEAEDAFRLASKYDPQNAKARTALAEMVKEKEEKAEAGMTGVELLVKSMQKRREGDHKKAIALLEEAVKRDKELEDTVKPDKEAIDSVDRGIDRILDHEIFKKLTGEMAKAEVEGKDDKYKEKLLDKWMNELSDASKKRVSARRAILDRHFMDKEGDRSDEEKRKRFFDIGMDLFREVGETEPSVPADRDSFFNRALVVAQELLEQGKLRKAYYLADFVMRRDPDAKRRGRAAFLKASSYIKSGDDKEGKNLEEAEKYYDEITDKKMRSEIALGIANMYAGRSGDPDLLKAEQAVLRGDAINYYRRAIEDDPSNIAALDAFMAFYGRDKADEIFADKNLERLKNALKTAVDMAFLSSVARAALSGAPSPEKLGTLRDILDRIRALLTEPDIEERPSDAAIIDFLRSLTNLLKDTKARVSDKEGIAEVDKIIDAMSDIRSSIEKDDVYRENTGINNVFTLLNAHLYMYSGRDGSAEIEKVTVQTDDDRAEVIFARLRGMLAPDKPDIQGAELALKRLTKADPEATPRARRQIAEALFIVATKTKDISDTDKAEYLERALQLWPEFKDAHREFAGLFAKTGNTEREAYHRGQVKAIGDRIIMPLAIEPSGIGKELLKHGVKAPLLERSLYFAVPLLAVLLAGGIATWGLGAFGFFLLPLGPVFNTGFALGAAVFIPSFVKAHKEGKPAAMAVSITSVALPLLFSLSPLVYIALAIAAHSAVNLIIFGINRYAGEKVLSYASAERIISRETGFPQEIMRPAGVPRMKPVVVSDSLEIAEERKIATVGILDVADEALAGFGEKYLDIKFMRVTSMEDLENAEGPQVRVFLDLREGIPIQEAVKIVRVQSFALRYPGLARLNEGSIEKLKTAALSGAAEIISQNIPNEVRESIDDLFSAGYMAGVAPEREPADAEGWTKESIVAFNEFLEARAQAIKTGKPVDRGPVEKVMGYFAGMVDFMRGKSDEVKRDILVEHEGVAKAQNVEAAVMGIFREFRRGELLPKTPQAIVIDARNTEESGFDLKAMRPALEAFAADKLIKVCVITRDAVPPAEIRELAAKGIVTHIVAGEDVAMQGIVQEVQNRHKEVATADIAVTAGEYLTKDMTDYIGENLMESTSFVVVGRGVVPVDAAGRRINRLIPSMAAMNILNRARDINKRPSVMTVGCSEENETAISNVREVLGRIFELIKIKAIDISREITSRIEALSEVARAL
ncbi:MAG: tetratricopeptide repeat protein, partial [Candidatus Omnitrophota bacterium]